MDSLITGVELKGYSPLPPHRARPAGAAGGTHAVVAALRAQVVDFWRRHQTPFADHSVEPSACQEKLERFVVRARPVEHQDPPHLLDGFGARARTERGGEVRAITPIGTRQPHFDQPVRGERPIDFSDDRLGRAVLADGDHGFEGVRTRLQRRALAWRQ